MREEDVFWGLPSFPQTLLGAVRRREAKGPALDCACSEVFLFLAVIHALPSEAISWHQRASQCRCLCWCLHFAGEGQALAGGRDSAKGPLRSQGREKSGRAPTVLSFGAASFDKSF